MTPEELAKQQRSDMQTLLQRPEFARFLFRVIQTSGIFSVTTDGSEGRHLVAEGRRQLGLEILDMAEEGQPVAHPDKLPVLTILQALREEAQQPAEKSNGRRSERYDRTADLDDGDGDD